LIPDEQLKDQSQQLSQILHKQQKCLDKRQKVFQQEDHIAEKFGKQPDLTLQPQSVSQDQLELEEKHRKLLQQQYELIEKKRQINEEQEELNKYISGSRGMVDGVDDNPVQSFLRLAHALFLYDATGTGNTFSLFILGIIFLFIYLLIEYSSVTSQKKLFSEFLNFITFVKKYSRKYELW